MKPDSNRYSLNFKPQTINGIYADFPHFRTLEKPKTAQQASKGFAEGPQAVWESRYSLLTLPLQDGA